MKRKDAPRLRKFIAGLLQVEFGMMKGSEMARTIKDMEWLAAQADLLEKDEIKPLTPSIPLPPAAKKGKKK